MARQNITPDTEHRQFEAYMDFSGGLNSEISNERLKPNEYPIMVNVDLSGRASARRRTGRDLVTSLAGTSQGMFAFYRVGQTSPDYIVAISGNLYVMAVGTTSLVLINITDAGSPWTFQTTLPIEAVQYQGSLFIATGTKIVELTYSGSAWVAVTVTPYTPSVMEAIYIGTNALAANPSAYIQDGVSASILVVGIQPATRTGAANADTVMTAYISKPAGVASLDYKWEYKKSQETAWVTGRDWTVQPTGKTWTFNQPTAGDYDIRVSIRDTAVPATVALYTLSNFEVKATADTPDLGSSGIQTCRKIMLHWDRLLLSGDSVNPSQMYISDLENPRYFPTTNSINFDTGKREPIRVVLRFQTYLIVMTDTTIQTLLGKDPSTYERFLIHDGIGCPCPESAAVIGNQVLFKSFEGVQSLTPNPYRVDTMNVKRIDLQIKSEIPKDTDGCALFYDNQYWLCFPQKNVIYRYYYEVGVWVKDTSTKLNIMQFLKYSDTVYNLTADGNIMKHNKDVYKDVDNVYDMIVETKLHDLSASFNNKKLRRLYLIAKHTSLGNVNLKVKVYADAAIILTPEDGDYVTDEDGYLTWQPKPLTPNFHFYTGTVIGSWVMGTSPLGNPDLSVQRASINGKCRRVKINVTHSDPIPCELYGFGIEFKLKKP